MSLEKLYTTRELAELLGIKPSVLACGRTRGSYSLKFIVLPNGGVRYAESDVKEWMSNAVPKPRGIGMSGKKDEILEKAHIARRKNGALRRGETV
jgi:hypothetical protein